MIPALIVGLGGTGAWVLTHLKYLLLQKHEDVLPSSVRLLAFDSTPASGAVVACADRGEVPNWPPELDWAHVRLVQGQEYFSLSCYLQPLVHAVAAGHHPHISAWFPARHWPSMVPPYMIHGNTAGVPRSFGRLMLFHDLASPSTSVVLRALTSSIEHLRQIAPPEGLQVCLVSSTFGATGSAWIADFAHLVRQIALPHWPGAAIHGFLVTPESFGAVIRREDSRGPQARSFATLREINRLQTTADPEMGYPMYYHEEGKDPIFRGRLRGRLFDSLTLVDGRAPNHPLSGTRPEWGVFPAIAEQLLSLLCDEVGPPVAPVGWAPGAAMACSAFGCASLVLPMDQVMDGLACRLALEILDALLAPVERDGQGMPTRLAPDQNREMGLRRGREAVEQFLTTSRLTDPRDPTLAASGTALMHDIVGLAGQFEADPRCYSSPSDIIPPYPRQRSEVDLQAELAARDRWVWQRAFCPEPHLLPDETVQILHTRVRDRCGVKVDLPGCLVLKRRREQAQAMAEAAMRSVKECLAGFLGEGLLEPQRESGEYERALESCASWNLQQASQMLTIWASIVLNGVSADARMAKGGKLGYLDDFLIGLRDDLERAHRRLLPPEFRKLFDSAARHYREHTEHLEHRVREGHRAPGCLALVTGASAIRLKRSVGDAQDELDKMADVVCAILVRQAEADTVGIMIEEVDRIRAAVAGWAYSQVRELYSGLLARLCHIEHLLSREEQIAVRQAIQDGAYQARLYDQYAHQMRDAVAELLGDFTWELSMTGEQPALRLTLSGQALEAGSLEALTDRCRDAFAGAAGHASLLDYLMQSHPNPNQWVDWLLAHSEPQLAPGPGAPFQAAYLQIAPPGDAAQAAYLNQAIVFLRAGLAGAAVQLVVSDDPFTCTFTRTLDGIPLDWTATHQQSRPAYQAYSSQPDESQSMLHVFPAEVNAARTEQRLPELGKEPHLLDDHLTVLLEDMDRVRQFALAYALDFIRKGSTAGGDSFVHLLLPSGGGLPAQDIWLTEPGPGSDGLAAALHTFAYLGRDVRAGSSQQMIDYSRVEWAIKETLGGGVSPIERKVQQLEAELAGLTGVDYDLHSVFVLLLQDELQ